MAYLGYIGHSSFQQGTLMEQLKNIRPVSLADKAAAKDIFAAYRDAEDARRRFVDWHPTWTESENGFLAQLRRRGYCLIRADAVPTPDAGSEGA